MAHDHRLVQTATLGGRRSQEPAFLPMTRSEALEFRRRHHASTFWCGDLLGGCGGRLGIKVYRDRVAHFAHHSSTNRCTRQRGGIDSADHLYAGKHVNRWLSGQGLPERRPHFDGDFATGGSCHRLTLPATDEHPAIFFEFTDRVDPGLERLLDHMADRSPSWLVQENPDLVHRLVRADGHALRFRMRTEGFERVVDIGVTSYGGHTRWHPIAECSLTREGITSPYLDELREERSRHRKPEPRPVSASTGDPVRAPSRAHGPTRSSAGCVSPWRNGTGPVSGTSPTGSGCTCRPPPPPRSPATDPRSSSSSGRAPKPWTGSSPVPPSRGYPRKRRPPPPRAHPRSRKAVGVPGTRSALRASMPSPSSPGRNPPPPGPSAHANPGRTRRRRAARQPGHVPGSSGARRTTN